MEIRGCTALVTGGAVRVGRAIALALADAGANVAITYRSSAVEAEQTRADLAAAGVRALAVRCDQRRPEQITAAVQAVEAGLGPADILVNNAAIFQRTPFAQATLEEWDAHQEVNVRGPWLFCQAVAPGMQARGAGVIINLVDVAVERPYPSYLPYVASKAGLVALTRGLARALAPAVRVNGIAPGTVLWAEDTPETQKEAVIHKTPLKRIGSPEDVAAAVRFLVEEGDFISGAIVPVDGGAAIA